MRLKEPHFGVWYSGSGYSRIGLNAVTFATSLYSHFPRPNCDNDEPVAR